MGGMSDYALWYRDDLEGRYRDEMEAKGWIGGTPDTNPGGYRARGGIHVVENLLTPVLVIHGRRDQAVPVHHAERYGARASELKKNNVEVVLNDRGHGSIEWPRALAFLKSHQRPRHLESKGTLLVHSFLACRSFWLVLDHPSRMAKVDYLLDRRGNLAALKFYQEDGCVPVEHVLLRLWGEAGRVRVEMAGRAFEATPISRQERYIDLKWPCAGFWMATVER